MERTGAFLSRRRLLIAMGGAATAAVAMVKTPLGPLVATRVRELVRARPVLSRMLISLADADFLEWRDQIGTNFALGGGVNMKLVSLIGLAVPGPRPANLNRTGAFMALFDVQNGATLPGDLIYTVNPLRYGAFQIFLSASTNPSLPHRMTAVFN
jgi:hypothetical protein